MENQSRKSQVKVCILTSAHPVFDVRIFHKEAKTLVNAGYDVVVVAQHDKKETVDGVRILPLGKAKNRFERMIGVVWKLCKTALKERADIYHFHDPELIFVGLTLKLLGKKVIYDIHENVPQDILAKEWITNNTIKKIISIIADKIQRFACIFFDNIIAAWPGIAEDLPKRKTIVLNNLPNLQLINNAKPAKIQKTNFTVIYAGQLNEVRGIKQIIQAMELVQNRAGLWLLGKWEDEEFRKDCERLAGWKYTKYLGLKKIDEMYSLMKKADIGIINFLPRPHNINALPNKPFEYMACKLPVIMSNFPYWKDIFNNSAIFINPADPKSIAEKIIFLIENPKEAKKLAETGRIAVINKYNWEKEGEKLIKIYQELSK